MVVPVQAERGVHAGFIPENGIERLEQLVVPRAGFVVFPVVLFELVVLVVP